jgi:hypothetical protein
MDDELGTTQRPVYSRSGAGYRSSRAKHRPEAERPGDRTPECAPYRWAEFQV